MWNKLTPTIGSPRDQRFSLPDQPIVLDYQINTAAHSIGVTEKHFHDLYRIKIHYVYIVIAPSHRLWFLIIQSVCNSCGSRVCFITRKLNLYR